MRNKPQHFLTNTGLTNSSNATKRFYYLRDGIGNSFVNMLIGNNVLDGGAGADTLTGGGGIDTLTCGAGMDIFELTTDSTDLITDFLSGIDLIRIDDLASGLGIGNQDSIIDTVTSGSGGFSASNELVIVTENIVGPITPASAAEVIGSATKA